MNINLKQLNALHNGLIWAEKELERLIYIHKAKYEGKVGEYGNIQEPNQKALEQVQAGLKVSKGLILKASIAISKGRVVK
jgi:hypothetical protein